MSITQQRMEEGAPIVHRLKVWVEFIPDLISGAKTFEARRDDRAFKVGDVLELFGWDRHANKATGWEQRRTVTYKLSGPAWGVEDEYCILGLSPITSPSQAMMVSADGAMLDLRMQIPHDLIAYIKEAGPVDWGAVGPKSDGDHLMDFASSLRQTREHFNTEGPQDLHGLYVAGTDVIAAHTGTSPVARDRARILAGLWNTLHTAVMLDH
jgi:hypothetical protein